MLVQVLRPLSGPLKAPALLRDVAVERGLITLGNFLSESKGTGAPKQGRGKFKLDDLARNQYFLWSLERVGVTLGLETIGGHDWYSWGSQFLMDTQAADGSWPTGKYSGAQAELNTSMALLFLCRANLASDLTKKLKGRIADPGAARLRAGEDLSGILGGPPKSTESAPMPRAVSPPVATASPNDYQAEVRRLSASFLEASSADRPAVLAKLRDSKGAAHTDALARAIPSLTGVTFDQAREALSHRLTRMTAATLVEMLSDPDREIRRAAALAIGMKEERQLVPDLIGKLLDREDMVARAARTSLKALTKQDFGPETDASAVEREQSAARWREWWKQNQ